MYWCRLCSKLLCSSLRLLSWRAENRFVLWVQVMACTILFSQERNHVLSCFCLLLGRECISINALISSGKETRDKSLLPRRKYWKGHIFYSKLKSKYKHRGNFVPNPILRASFLFFRSKNIIWTDIFRFCAQSAVYHLSWWIK